MRLGWTKNHWVQRLSLSWVKWSQKKHYHHLHYRHKHHNHHHHHHSIPIITITITIPIRSDQNRWVQRSRGEEKNLIPWQQHLVIFNKVIKNNMVMIMITTIMRMVLEAVASYHIQQGGDQVYFSHMYYSELYVFD